MSIESKPLPPEPPEIAALNTDERRLSLETRKAQADVGLKIDELKLSERDIVAKEEANKKSAFRDPVLLGVIAAAIGLLGNFGVAWYTQYVSHTMAVEKANTDKYLARQRADSDLILEATKSPDYDTRVTNLNSILSLGLISDPETAKRLKAGLTSGLIPNNSASQTSRPAAITGFGKGGYGTGGYGGASGGQSNSSVGSGQSISAIPSEKLIVEKMFVVPPGSYAQSSNPPCVDASIENVAGIARDIAANQLASDHPALSSLVPTSDDEIRTVMVPLNFAGILGIGDPNRPASCAIVAARLTSKHHSVRVDVSASDSLGNWQPCKEQSGTWMICGIGWSAWSYNVLDDVIVATFKNWSADRTRSARIQVYGTD